MAGSHSCIVDEVGRMWVWGHNHRGCLGLDSLTAVSADHRGATVATHGQTEMKALRLAKPLLHPLLGSSTLRLHVRSVSCASMHVLACVDSPLQPVFSWGRGDAFRLGHGDLLDRVTPTPVTALAGLDALQVFACGTVSAVLLKTTVQTRVIQGSTENMAASTHTTRQQLVVWGTAPHGQLGLGPDVQVAGEPTPLIFFDRFNKSVQQFVSSHRLYDLTMDVHT
jgi:alpha-tubulin suppressor-like RCC1 family protein